MKNENVSEPIEEPAIRLEKRPLKIVTAIIILSFFFDLYIGAIHGVATPSIIATLGGMQFYALTITAYMVGGCIGRIISGKLGDLYGRKRIYLFSLVLFVLGDVLCGSAQSITQLVAYKVVLGIAGGFLYSTCYSIVADLYVSKTRVKILGYLTSMIGIVYIVGPLLGGYIVDTLSWRWLYFGTVPILIVCFLIMNYLLPTVKQEVKVTIDYLGILFLCGTVIPFLLVLTWGGSTYSWGSPIMIVLYVISLLSLAMFVFVERRVIDPILPLNILNNRYFMIPNIAYALYSYFGIIYLTYIPLFGQAVKGMSAAASGSLLTPLMIALIISSPIISTIIRKTGRYKSVMLFLFVWTGIMFFLVSGFNENTSLWYVYSVLGMIGVGMSGFNLVFIAYLQNHLPHNEVGAATGAMYFFTNIAMVISLSVAGFIMNTNWQVDKYLPPQLKESLSASGLKLMSSSQGLTNKSAAALTRSQLPPELQSIFDHTIIAMKGIMVQIFEYMYVINTAVCMIGVLFIALFLKEKKIQRLKRQVIEISEVKE